MPSTSSLVRLVGLALLASPAAGQTQAPELIDLLPGSTNLWVEIPDVDRLGAELAASSLGQFAGLLSEEIDPEEIALRLSLPEEALDLGLAGQDGGVRRLLRAAAVELGLTEEQAEGLTASMGGALILARGPAGAGGGELGGVVIALSLVPGGSLRLVDGVLGGLEAAADEGEGVELLELARGEDECTAAWRWQAAGEVPAGFLVVRPGLAACTFERDLAERLLRGESSDEREAHDAGLVEARAASRARGELVYVRAAGERLARAARSSDARVLLEGLGIDQLAAVEIGLRVRDGQLASRVRLELAAGARPPRPSGPTDPPAAEPWTVLDVIPTDAVVVLGLARSPWEAAEGLFHLAGHMGYPAGEAWLERMLATPFLASLRAPDALARETIVFVRPAGPGIPLVYAATPATPALDRAFEVLDRRRSEEFTLGSGLRLRPKPIADGKAWVLYAERGRQLRSVLALTRTDEAWVGSDVSAQLQSLLRQRSRERLTLRAEAVRRVREAVANEVREAGREPEEVLGFLHVRTSQLAELLWPYAQLALQLTGAVEDPEDLPDPLDVADIMGDTTLVLLDLGDAFELWGSGLLGGLVLLF